MYRQTIRLMGYDLYSWSAAYIFRVEKYRPDTLDDLISHQDIINTSKYNHCLGYRLA